jgi:predicted DNA-binding ribbon-helix-helix protein
VERRNGATQPSYLWRQPGGCPRASLDAVAAAEARMKSLVVKRSVVLAGHKTSVSLEDAFWKALKEIAGERDMTSSDLVAAIDSERQHGNLSSAIRLFVLDFYRDQVPRPSKGEQDS